jgi:hypothetical protein
MIAKAPKALVAMWAGRSSSPPPQTTVEPRCFDAKGSRANMIRRIRMEVLRANGQSASLQLSPGKVAVFVPR